MKGLGPRERCTFQFVIRNGNPEVLIPMRIAAVDLVSSTCFPALAAEELGFYKAEGLDVQIELFPQLRGAAALKEGKVDAMMAGSVYDLLTPFPQWAGVKLLVALSHGTPWLLVVRADLPAERGDLGVLKGLRIAAAHGPDLAFKKLLIDADIDIAREEIQIVYPAGSEGAKVSFGVFAAEALKVSEIDGFWANAMGAETAVRAGAGKILLDVRRGDGPPEARHYTFAALATTDEFLTRDPVAAAAAVRAIVKTQKALRADPALALKVGERRFPPEAAPLIAAIVEQDLPFYQPAVLEEDVGRLNGFAQSMGILSRPVPYEQVVAVRFRGLWAS